jgi:hypothetical protein
MTQLQPFASQDECAVQFSAVVGQHINLLDCGPLANHYLRAAVHNNRPLKFVPVPK